jgi:hypothetical protein
MKISLKQRDIELAIKMYLANQGIALANRDFAVQFTAGRKGSGLSALVNIGEADALVQAAVEAVLPETPVLRQKVQAQVDQLIQNDEVVIAVVDKAPVPAPTPAPSIFTLDPEDEKEEEAEEAEAVQTVAAPAVAAAPRPSLFA